MSKYSQWRYLCTYGQWRDDVIPDWARDVQGRMNEMFAMRAVIEELTEALIPFALAATEWSGIAADHLTLRQAHEATPGEVDSEPVTVKHLLHAAEVMKK